MRLSFVHTLLLGAAVSVAAAPQFADLSGSDPEAVLAALQKQAEDALKAQEEAEGQGVAERSLFGSNGCHLGNAAIRRDW